VGNYATPYGKICKILFQNFSSRHRSTLLCSNFVKCCQLETNEIVRYLSDRKKKCRLPLKLSLLRGSRLKSARASPQHWAHNIPSSSKSVHFRRSYSRLREHRLLPRRVAYLNYRLFEPINSKHTGKRRYGETAPHKTTRTIL